MILTHPEFPRTKIPTEKQRELALLGVIIEHCWYNIGENECEAAEMANNILAVGCDNCYISSDRGQYGRETPVEAMQRFISLLLEHGITEQQIQTMLIDVPKKVLAIH